MWFGTNNGVCKYNGKEFTTYTTSQGLTDNSVLTLCEDHHGRIWFGPQNNELCYWYRDSIHHVGVGKTFPAMLSSPNIIILGLYADSVDNIWINTTQSLYVARADKHYNSVEPATKKEDCHFFVQKLGRQAAVIARQTLERANGIYGSTTLHIGFETVSGRQSAHFNDVLTNHSFPFPGYIATVISAQDGRLLFAFGNRIFTIAPDGKTEVKEFDKPITRLISDKDYGLWVGFYQGGVLYYKNQNLHAAPIHCLEKYTVGCIYKDHEGGVWATTLEHGVFYCPSLFVYVYPTIPLLDDHIIFMGKLNDKVIANTFGRNVFELDTLQIIAPCHRFNRFENKFKKFGLLRQVNDMVYVCFSDKTVLFDQALNAIQSKGKVTVFSTIGRDLIEGADHSVWVIHGGGLIKLAQSGAESYQSRFRLTCAAAGSKGALYVGGKSGLYLFQDGNYVSLASVDPLLKNGITCIRKDAEGNIWLGTTGAGVLLLRNNQVYQCTSHDGLASDICNVLEVDSYGHIWVGTPAGLSCIMSHEANRGGWIVRGIDKRNGLNSNEITKLYAAGPILWVGTMSGISSIRILEMLTPAPAASVYIGSLRVNNSLTDTNQITFPFNHNNFKFTLEGLTFSDNTDHIYRYSLLGQDSSWQQTNSKEVAFNNLSPGHYSFRVEVANRAGIWSTAPAVYHFVITPPFWLRWWFLVMMVLILGLAVYLVIELRTGVITKREEEKTRIGKLLAEYQLKALRAQMNPHFIFNALNSIQNFVLRKDVNQAYDYLVKFSKLIRSVLNNTKENEISLQQELDTLSLYVELEQLRFEQAFDFHLKIDPKIEAAELIIPALLIQPYAENAIWHGLMPLKERKGILSVEIEAENNVLKIVISDNGVGRTASNLIKKNISHQSMGMELSSKRVELFGLGLEEASVQICDIYVDGDSPAGTRVEIILPLLENY
jgi:sensor histidine kinase YesM